ncbi:MAG: thiamine phosphate synthase [Actinomycetota bacterium]
MHPIRDRLESCLLYLITPALPPAGALDEFLPRVLEAGVDMVQLREKEMEAGLLMPYCEIARSRSDEFGALFIVNDRVDLAIAAGADGVHLGQDDLPYIYARDQMGPDRLIGRSTHSPAQLNASVGSGADYSAVGPIYATPTKPGRPAVGEELVSYAAAYSNLPVFAIGGINASNIGSVIAAGARRACVVRALTESSDPAEAAARLKRELSEASGS